MSPVLSPENIYAHPHQEGDVILWYNRALWHSIVRELITFLIYMGTNSREQTEFPESYGPRIMHQCNIAASDHPSG
jgi:alpha-ketoglutarate-dependent taurine dioxygenase